MSDQSHEKSSNKEIADPSSSSKLNKLNQKLSEQKKNETKTPFTASPGSSKDQALKANEYGRPKAGSLTEVRGKKANVHVYKEMLELCQVIHVNGTPIPGNSHLREIKFGELFDIYVYISNKVNGLLIRARKYELLTFEGECLFQKFHDHVPIRLLQSMDEIKKILKEKQDEVTEHGCKYVLKE